MMAKSVFLCAYEIMTDLGLAASARRLLNDKNIAAERVNDTQVRQSCVSGASHLQRMHRYTSSTGTTMTTNAANA